MNSSYGPGIVGKVVGPARAGSPGNHCRSCRTCGKRGKPNEPRRPGGLLPARRGGRSTTEGGALPGRPARPQGRGEPVMTARRSRWAAALGLLLGLHAAGRGQDVWHAVGTTPTTAPPAVVAATPPGPAPAVTLGRPQPLEAPAAAPSAFPDGLISRVSYGGQPLTDPDVVQAQA